MKLLKKTCGLVPQVSSSGLAAPETTTPTEPSGWNGHKHGLDCHHHTTNGTGSKPPTGQASHKFSGLFDLDHPAKKTQQVFAKIVVSLRSAQKEGKHSTQPVPTYTVDQSVNTEEVVAINNTSANHSELAELAPGIPLEKDFFQEEFPLAIQTQAVEAESTKSTFPEIATAQDTALKCATANGSTTTTPNNISGSKIKSYWKRLSVPKEGHRNRKGTWWKRPKGSKLSQSAVTRKFVWKTEEASEDGFCRDMFRKLHVEWATRKVGGWSRKVRMAANSSCSETSSGLGGESTEEMQDETDETEDTESIETFNGMGESPVVVVSVGEELQATEESDCEVAGNSTQISPKMFPGVLPSSQLSDLSSKCEDKTPIETQAGLEQESDPSPYATQELICRVMERFGQPCDDSLMLTETTFLKERGLSSFLPDTERKKQNSRPVSSARNLNEIMGLEIEEESMASETPQINEEALFRTRKFTLAPSNPAQGFMKELQLVERRSGHVDAERLESVPKTTEGVEAETEKTEESTVQSVESISEIEAPLKRPECGSLVRRSTGFTLDVIERNAEIENETPLHQHLSCLDTKDSEELKDADCNGMARGLGSSPIAPHETLWHVLGLTEQEEWQRIRNNFVQGKDLHITSEAKTQLSSLSEMRSAMIQKANLGDNNDCKADSHCSQKPLEQPWTVEDRQTLAEEMLQRFIDCRATMMKFSGKIGLAELKEPLDTFTSCFDFTLNKYVRVQKKQFSDYSHYLSEIQTSVAMAVSVLDGAGDQFCNLLEYISTTPKSPQSMSEVQEKAAVLMSLISTSGLILQKAQKALAQVTPEDLQYALTMVDVFQKSIHSQTHICYTYKMFRLVFLPDPLEKEEANAATGFGVFDDELYALHEPSSYAGMAAFAENLGTLQTCCDVVNKAGEELEAFTNHIIGVLCKLNPGGSAAV
ncbi:hypothetical protein JCM33374_g389 [Metschnikowia sp. JCM 33374]|nr:hypothetical protein JCM33374_g389 [Metschnikowia sp. JCM 33374]